MTPTTEPTRQPGPEPRHLRAVPPPIRNAVHVPWYRIQKSTVVDLGWWCLYSFGGGLALAALYYAADLIGHLLHG